MPAARRASRGGAPARPGLQPGQGSLPPGRGSLPPGRGRAQRSARQPRAPLPARGPHPPLRCSRDRPGGRPAAGWPYREGGELLCRHGGEQLRQQQQQRHPHPEAAAAAGTQRLRVAEDGDSPWDVAPLRRLLWLLFNRSGWEVPDQVLTFVFPHPSP